MNILRAIGKRSLVKLRKVVRRRLRDGAARLEPPPLASASPITASAMRIGRIAPLFDRALVDEVLAVTSEDAKAMARRLAREEAIFAGTSSGGNVVAALRLAERLGPGKTVVALMVDSGLKYLSTDVFARRS